MIHFLETSTKPIISNPRIHFTEFPYLDGVSLTLTFLMDDVS